MNHPGVWMDLVPLPANLVPIASGPYGAPSLAPTVAPTNWVARMAELQQFLVQCDDPSYVYNYCSVSFSFIIVLYMTVTLS